MTIAQTGNFYEKISTDAGIPTFRHKLTGEVLHAQVGPYQEAMGLYVLPSGMMHAEGDLVLYDCGMGVGTLLLAARDVFLRNAKLRSMHVVSFDLEKKGLSCLLENIDSFAYAKPHLSFLESILKQNFYKETLILQDNISRSFSWEFVEGDFSQTVHNALISKADVIFFDFFSPQNLPDLWRWQNFKRLYELSNDRAKLITYSSATAARTSLFASGWYVGYGVPSGKVNFTTYAAKNFSDLTKPIEHSWLRKYEASHLRYVGSEPKENYSQIDCAIYLHPQLQKEL